VARALDAAIQNSPQHSTASSLLTISEALAVIESLDASQGIRVSARQLRHWFDTFALDAGRSATTPTAVHIFTPEDIAIARLILRLRRDGISARVSGAARSPA
jgi:DNA-binding transcriptional MerR regulator